MRAMECFLTCGRIFALVSNILFGCVSLGLVITGFVVRFVQLPVNEKTMLKIKDSARDAFGVSLSTNNVCWPIENMKQSLSIFLIVTGILSAPLVVFGFYTFLREKRNFLLAYTIILGFLLVIQSFLIYYFGSSSEKVIELIKPYLLVRINEYAGIHSSDEISLGWNYLMQEYHCCGAESYLDFQWSSFSAANGCHSSQYYLYPGCCQTLPSSISTPICYITYPSSYYPFVKYCGESTTGLAIWRVGCAKALFGAYYTNNTGVIWSPIAVSMVNQIVLFVLAITVLKKNRDKVEPLRSFETKISTIGGTQTSKMGLPLTETSNQLPEKQNETIPSVESTQYSLHPGHVSPTSTSATQPTAQPTTSTVLD